MPLSNSPSSLASPVDLGLTVEREGLLGLASAMNAQGDVAFRSLLHGTRSLPKGRRAALFVREALKIEIPSTLIRANLAGPERLARLNVRLDPTPVRTFEGTTWNTILVTGRLNLAALLGLPTESPVEEVNQLMRWWQTWESYWGPAPTMEAWLRRPRLQIYKVSDRLSVKGAAWSWGKEHPDRNARFAEDLASDPFRAQWLHDVQRGLAKLRLGPHSWVTVDAPLLEGRAPFEALPRSA